MRTLSLAFLFVCAGFAKADDYPHVTLKVKGLQATVYTPDPDKGFYRGSRFAWAGVIKDVQFNNHTIYGPWKDKHNPKNNDDITGPAEEFGMNVLPLGYAEAKVGETFLKIGVGELEKPKEEKYRFFYNYPIKQTGTRTVTKVKQLGETRSSVEMRQTLTTSYGFAYHYKKSITLSLPENASSPTLNINYELVNIGTKLITTDYYNHNFFNVDGVAIGPEYTLLFPKSVRPTQDSKFTNVAIFKEGSYTFTKTLGTETPFGWLTDGENTIPGDDFTHVYNDTKNNHRLQVHCQTVDLPTTKFQTWSIKGAMCPEPFAELKLAPGEGQSWATHYTFRVSR